MTYDVVVVGGGSAGAIVAARLAGAGDRTVCLLEAGPSDEGDARILEIGRWLSVAGSELSRELAIEPQERGNSRLVHSRAYVLGGCGSHNQGIALLPPSADLDEWERLGATGWGSEGTAPFFARVLDRVHVEEASRGNACAAAFVQAGREAGLPALSFADREAGHGVGWLRLNVRDGLRQSASVAYLHPLAAQPPSLTVRTGTTATRVVLEGDRALGVETPAGIVSARETILCCGAIETPKLLLLSGIGPAAHLREVGVPVVHDLPDVGEGFLDHPEATLVWEASRPVPTGVVQDWEAGALADGAMIHFGTMPADPAWLPIAERAEHAFWMTPNVMRPRSRGVLRLRSADPADPPRIDPRYYTDPGGEDERAIVAGMKLARRIAAQPALAAWVRRELVPGPDVVADDELSAYAQEHGTTVQHPAGTCRIGAVVDPQLRVRGVAGLRVADASVFPAMIGVNVNLTCMMVGEKCADLVLTTEGT